jgi:hypothetical protein
MMATIRPAALVLLVCACSRQGSSQTPARKDLPPALARATAAKTGPVEAEKRQVLYPGDDRVTLQIG